VNTKINLDPKHVDSTADRGRVPEQPARKALEAKDRFDEGRGENRSGGCGRVERGKPRRGKATYDLQTLQNSMGKIYNSHL
jgi:hypothetical protein